MKKVLTYLLVGIFLLSGCNACDSASLEDTAEKENVYGNCSYDYNVYIPEEDIEFIAFIDNNPIDRAYGEDFPDNGNISEMAKTERLYAEIWEKEMSSSLAAICDVVSEDDAKTLIDLQNGWQLSVIGTIDFEQNILLTEKYGISMGSMYSYSSSSAYLRAYKERTIHLKYLHYCIIRSNHPELSFEEMNMVFYHNP